MVRRITPMVVISVFVVAMLLTSSGKYYYIHIHLLKICRKCFVISVHLLSYSKFALSFGLLLCVDVTASRHADCPRRLADEPACITPEACGQQCKKTKGYNGGLCDGPQCYCYKCPVPAT
jgi:hypothetical protein